jgi:hypothetical protein
MRLHQIKNLCTVKETIARVKRQSTKCEKIFSSYSSGKEGLINRMHKELKKLYTKIANNAINKSKMGK